MTHDIAALLLAAGLVTMPCVVGQMARERGVDVGRALATVTLESAWDADAVGDGGLAVGFVAELGKRLAYPLERQQEG